MAGVKKTMNHSEYMESLKSKTIPELLYIRRDAHNAAKAMPTGPNAGYYWDEVHYCSMELRRRQLQK